MENPHLKFGDLGVDPKAGLAAAFAARDFQLPCTVGNTVGWEELNSVQNLCLLMIIDG